MASELIQVTVKGQALINAVEKIANEPIIKKEYVDGKDVFNIGQTSATPYEQVIVVADGNRNIDPFAVYSEVAVMGHKWPEPEWIHAIGYGPQSVKKAVYEFAERLKAELAI